MSHTSPASYLVWSIITCILFAFMVFHLWSYDHFKCLKWNNGPYSGAFKRVMTYSYLLSVPLIMTYALGFAIIKYGQGYIEFEGVIIPKPYIFWPEAERRAIFPLMLTFTIAWSLEMTTHLEELCFWFFLVFSGPIPPDWFRSTYFRIWVVGSCIAIIYMPLLTILSRSDPLKSEAYTFLGGSLGGLTLTLSFLPVLWEFPAFLASLKREGVDSATIVRLTKFHELNMIRVAFRFVFVVPLVILGLDGIRPHKHINESMLWTDFLTMIAAFGCCISSALTLVIFFPRSVDGEIAAKDAAREKRRKRLYGGHAPSSHFAQDDADERLSHYAPSGQYLLSSSKAKPYTYLSDQDGYAGANLLSPQTAYTERSFDGDGDSDTPDPHLHQMAVLRPNRRAEAVELRGIPRVAETNRRTSVNPLVHNFTSPIDLYGGEGPPTLLAFTQH
ncbi:hypothetical protein B0H13DRAFT_2016497 [Mycena leptocephala]|nr:hypothetical protein B0H13DRAFT_2016497 [Mycena leptocephala]